MKNEQRNLKYFLIQRKMQVVLQNKKPLSIILWKVVFIRYYLLNTKY